MNTMNAAGSKRPGGPQAAQSSPHKRPKMAGRSGERPKTGGMGGGVGPTAGMSFAQKILMKAGWREGQSLGKTGEEGIKEAIQVKLRPQGLGLGGIKEMTPQAKAEARKAAERRGEEYEEDSDDEEKLSRRRMRTKAQESAKFTTRSVKQKQEFRLESLEITDIPSIFKNLVDMTGSQPKAISSASELAASQTFIPRSEESQTARLATAARRELEAFDAAWRELQDRRTYVDLQLQEAQKENKRRESEALSMRQLCDAVTSISIDLESSEVTSKEECALAAIERIRDEPHATKLERDVLEEVTVAALHPLFRQALADWQPFDSCGAYSPHPFSALLRRLSSILLPKKPEQDDLETHFTHQQSAGPYESMILTLWLPRVRSVIVNDWDPTNPDPLIALINDWKDVLPRSVYDLIINSLIVLKLDAAIKDWRPEKPSDISPQEWLFPWLEYIDEYHLDPKSATGLLASVRRQLRSSFDHWNPNDGVIKGLGSWLKVSFLRHVLKKDLETRMLPNLARYLNGMDINPADQDITRVENFLRWKGIFSYEKLSRPLLDAFFPKFHKVLYEWLTADPDYVEVGEWFAWWKEVFPAEINAVNSVNMQWEQGQHMLESAADLGDRVKDNLQMPFNEAKKKEAPPAPNKPQTQKFTDLTEPKDLVEDLCERNGLLLVPLRKAHPENGLPLFRITANAVGSGGLVVYFRGDLVWAQNKRDRSSWEPLDVFDEATLIQLAESK